MRTLVLKKRQDHDTLLSRTAASGGALLLAALTALPWQAAPAQASRARRSPTTRSGSHVMTAPCAAPRRRRPRRAAAPRPRQRPQHRRLRRQRLRQQRPPRRRGRPDHRRNPNAPCASRPLPPHRRRRSRAEPAPSRRSCRSSSSAGAPYRGARRLHRRGRHDLGADRQPTHHRLAGPAVRRRAQARRHGQLLPRAEGTGPRHSRAIARASGRFLPVQVLLEPPGLEKSR